MFSQVSIEADEFEVERRIQVFRVQTFGARVDDSAVLLEHKAWDRFQGLILFQCVQYLTISTYSFAMLCSGYSVACHPPHIIGVVLRKFLSVCDSRSVLLSCRGKV